MCSLSLQEPPYCCTCLPPQLLTPVNCLCTVSTQAEQKDPSRLMLNTREEATLCSSVRPNYVIFLPDPQNT